MAINRPLRPPVWFWIVAILFVLWGVSGCYSCLQQIRLGADSMGAATTYDRAFYAALPGWYNPVFALAVGAGLIGSLLLLARSGAARTLYVVSFVAVIVMFGWVFLTTDLIAVKGPGEALSFPIVIFLIGVAQIWFAGLARRRGWIR